MAESTVKFADGIKDAIRGEKKSRAFIGSLIIGNAYASPSLASSDTLSTSSGSNNSSRTSTPKSVASCDAADIERCSCCTIDDFWKIYDSFRLMDRRACGSVRRCDFYEAITEHVTLDMRRTMTRGDLHERFRSCASDMTLAELLGRVWPTITDGDRKMIGHWAKLRDASSVTSCSSFQGTREDLKRIFDLLDVECSQSLSMHDLVRARILTKDESHNLLKDWYKAFNKNDSGSDSGSVIGQSQFMSLSFADFCRMTQEHLSEKYVQKVDTNSWAAGFASAFNASKATTTKLNAAREDLESLSRDRPSPSKKSLKIASAGRKTTNVSFGFSGQDLSAQEDLELLSENRPSPASPAKRSVKLVGAGRKTANISFGFGGHDLSNQILMAY